MSLRNEGSQLNLSPKSGAEDRASDLLFKPKMLNASLSPSQAKSDLEARPTPGAILKTYQSQRKLNEHLLELSKSLSASASEAESNGVN